MQYLNARFWPWVALLISAGLLCGAWFFQYALGYAPCQMCYWQRHAHKVIVGLALLALVMNRQGIGRPRVWTLLIGLGFLVSVYMAMWHVGVEQGWWEGPKTCISGTPKLGEFTGTDLLNSLNKPVKLPGCAAVAWSFLGLSMAGWNALVSLGGAVLSFVSSRKDTHA